MCQTGALSSFLHTPPAQVETMVSEFIAGYATSDDPLQDRAMDFLAARHPTGICSLSHSQAQQQSLMR